MSLLTSNNTWTGTNEWQNTSQFDVGLTALGASSFTSLSTSGNVSIGGTLGVTGVCTLSTLGVTDGATIGGTLTVNGAMATAITTLALNGASQTIPNTACVVRITGATATSTIAMPAAPVAGQVIDIDSQATATYTLSGNGVNIDGAATKSITTAGPLQYIYTGSVWESMTWPIYNLDARYARLGASNIFAAGSNQTFNGVIVLSPQVSAVSFTVSNTGGPWVSLTAGGITASLPSVPVNGQIFIISDDGGNALVSPQTISGNGKNIAGSPTATINTNYGVLRVHYNGTQWITW